MTKPAKWTNISLMRWYIIGYFFALMFGMLLPAQASTEHKERRIEEQNRSNLLSTENPSRPSLRSAGMLEQSAEVNYLAKLLTVKKATLKDATQVLCLLLGAQIAWDDYDSQAAFLARQNIFPPKISSRPDPGLFLRKGIAAYMFCKALSIKGGLTLRLLSSSPRYALRELAYEGIMESGSTRELVSGRELVVIFSNAAQSLIKRAGAAGE